MNFAVVYSASLELRRERRAIPLVIPASILVLSALFLVLGCQHTKRQNSKNNSRISVSPSGRCFRRAGDILCDY